MANIKVNDIKPTGSELFADSESFLNELGDSEMDVQGGFMLAINSTVYIGSVAQVIDAKSQ